MIHNFIKTFILTHVALADVFCPVLKTNSLFPSAIFAAALFQRFFTLYFWQKSSYVNSFTKTHYKHFIIRICNLYINITHAAKRQFIFLELL